jgi:hypothetical protein
MPRRCDVETALAYYRSVLQSKDWKRLETYFIKRRQEEEKGYPPIFYLTDRPNIQFVDKLRSGWVGYASLRSWGAPSICILKSYWMNEEIVRVRKTIRHEMIHLMLYLNKLDGHHGHDFRKCSRILHNYGSIGEPRVKSQRKKSVVQIPVTPPEDRGIEISILPQPSMEAVVQSGDTPKP